MQPESHPVSQSTGDTSASMDASYWPRMLLAQRWRRIAWLVCLFLALWALLFVLLDPGFQHPSTVMLVKSMFAFIVAVVAAVNFLTFRLRK
jgi:hypothetical protein